MDRPLDEVRAGLEGETQSRVSGTSLSDSRVTEWAAAAKPSPLALAWSDFPSQSPADWPWHSRRLPPPPLPPRSSLASLLAGSEREPPEPARCRRAILHELARAIFHGASPLHAPSRTVLAPARRSKRADFRRGFSDDQPRRVRLHAQRDEQASESVRRARSAAAHSRAREGPSGRPLLPLLRFSALVLEPLA